LDLGDRAKRCLSEDPACGLFSRAEAKLKQSDDVIESTFTTAPDSRISDLSRTSGYRRETRLFLESHPFSR